MLRTHTCGELNKSFVGKEVILCGWVRRIREIGSITFIDLRDRYGRVQIVIEDKNLIKNVDIGLEYVIRVKGIVRKRPEKDINPEHPTGEIEVLAHYIELLNTSKPLPFLPEDNIQVNEETRLKYRFIDLRRPIMQKNFIIRHKTALIVRNFLSENGFLEIETPFLTKSTPEGARDFIVPSRLNPKKFYALPQSPQLYKQTLMISGFDRYFQIVRCFRDEDLRADRQPEFTQIDIEMSFVDVEDVLNITEKLIWKIFKEILNIELEIPFLKLSYKDAIINYGSDKPDLRSSIKLMDLTEFIEGFNIFDKIKQNNGKIIALPIPLDLSRKEIDEIRNIIGEFVFFKKFNSQISGQIAKYIKNYENLSDGTYIVVAGYGLKPYKILGSLRNEIIKKYKLFERDWAILWVLDFPLFEWNEEEKRIEPSHHIFTSIHNEDLEKLEELERRLKNKEDYSILIEQIRGKQYDLVINGNEIGSGSIRVHNRALQEKFMKIIGLSDEEINRKFGFFLNILEYGAPPHGGIALGFDRIIALLTNNESIREVIAFPKTTSGQALFEDAPSEVDISLLNEHKETFKWVSDLLD
ncbi:MAG: aspartate--tRNA ligase [candidate division WOR-3 bacterium]